MLADKIMQSDLLDILFENRNKAYGAYTLRKLYNKTMFVSLSFTLLVALAFSAFEVLHHPALHTPVKVLMIPPDNKLVKIQEVKLLPKQSLLKHPTARVHQNIHKAPVIVNDDVKTQMLVVDDLIKSAIGSTKIPGRDEDLIQNPSDGFNGTAAASKVFESKYDERPLVSAQVMPEYPGGIEALRKFMLKNLRQPDNLQQEEKIVVLASFIVNKNGQVEKVKITNSGRADLDKEVERVIKKMPLWKPGKQNGNAVAVYFNLPVTFRSADVE